jgi:glycine oxidase
LSTHTTDVVVIGAGIVGSLTSYLLCRRGLSVTMLEADNLGSHASGMAFGGLDPLNGIGVPDPLLDFSLYCFGRHWSIARELQGATGIDPRFRTRDRLYLAFDDTDIQQYDAEAAWMKDVSMFDVHWLDGDAARRLEPKVNPNCIGGLFHQGAASVDAYRLTLASIRAAERFGTKLVMQRATGLEHSGGHAIAVTLEEGKIEAGTVVVAMGPWSNLLTEWCGAPAPVEPLKGQILRMRYDGPPFNVALNYRGNYVDSKPDGLIWAGSTEEDVGFDNMPNSRGRDSILSDLALMAPSVVSAQLMNHTACLRPVTPDGIPVVGRLPGWDNLYLATGAGRKGILWSVGMSQVAADLITQGETEVVGAEHLAPGRFAQV